MIVCYYSIIILFQTNWDMFKTGAFDHFISVFINTIGMTVNNLAWFFFYMCGLHQSEIRLYKCLSKYGINTLLLHLLLNLWLEQAVFLIECAVS